MRRGFLRWFGFCCDLLILDVTKGYISAKMQQSVKIDAFCLLILKDLNKNTSNATNRRKIIAD